MVTGSYNCEIYLWSLICFCSVLKYLEFGMEIADHCRTVQQSPGLVEPEQEVMYHYHRRPYRLCLVVSAQARCMLGTCLVRALTFVQFALGHIFSRN